MTTVVVILAVTLSVQICSVLPHDVLTKAFN